jgi:hypothetical protein
MTEQQQNRPIETWYLAICQNCTPILPQPFHDFEERVKWTKAHRDGTGHTVTYEEETRT